MALLSFLISETQGFSCADHIVEETYEELAATFGSRSAGFVTTFVS
jgi:hypothetical protein